LNLKSDIYKEKEKKGQKVVCKVSSRAAWVRKN